jgi:hypothetical protein
MWAERSEGEKLAFEHGKDEAPITYTYLMQSDSEFIVSAWLFQRGAFLRTLAARLIDIARSCRREGTIPDISSPNASQ